ncbi:MAG: flagellar hook protein FlgE [Candidatus Scalinduaceae bacterium]
MTVSSLVSGISGLKTSQTALNVIGNNLANMNTPGFKVSRVTFANQLAQTLRAALAPGSGLGGRNPIQVGSGATVASITKNFSQGSIAPTGRPFDLAIEGEGFFILSNGTQEFYTRVGSFILDKNNDLIDAGTGLKVKSITGTINIPVNTTVPAQATTTVNMAGNLNSATATGAINQVVQSATPFQIAGPAPAVAATPLNSLLTNTAAYTAGEVINIIGTEANGATVSASFVYGSGAGQNGTTLGELRDFITASFGTATATIDASGNIVLTATSPGASSLSMTIADATGQTGATTWTSFGVNTVGKGEVFTTTVSLFNAQGTSIPVTLTFERTASNTWGMTATMDPSEGSVTTAITAINFNNNGTLASVTGTPTITVTYPNSTTQAVTLDFGVPNGFSGITQFSGTSSAAATNQNGFAAGFFSSSTVNSNGTVVALFTNGQTQEIGQLQLATFSNPAGLSQEGENLLTATVSSGEPILKAALSGGVGTIVSGALEGSNVDIAEEFTNLIVSQRAFQANARTITTTDEVLQELVNIIR